jgi:hypothetical protein
MSELGGGGGGSGAAALPNAAAFPALHQALSKVMGGTGDASIIIVGDSIASGLFTTNIGMGITTQMIKTLAGALGIPVAAGLAAPLNTNIAGPDNRWTLGTGWSWGDATFANLGLGGLPTAAAALVGANAAAGTASFQPVAGTPNYDTFDVYWLPTGATYNINFNGGANTGIPGTGTGCQKTTVSGASTSRPTLNFNTVVGALGAVVLAVEPRLSTTPTLRIGNAGMTASDTGGWSLTGNSSAQNCLTVINPDLIVVNLGYNDLGHGLSLAQSQANWAVLASGVSKKIIFSSECPINPTTGFASSYAPYWIALKTFCQLNNYGFIDIFNGYGGQAGFAALAAMTPDYYGDGNSVHPSTNGSPDYGRMLAQGLLAL